MPGPRSENSTACAVGCLGLTLVLSIPWTVVPVRIAAYCRFPPLMTASTPSQTDRDQEPDVVVSSLDDPRLGVDDRSVLQLLATAFSDYICLSKSDSGGHVLFLSRVLIGYATTEVLVTPDGVPENFILLDPPHPDIDAQMVARTGATARRMLGLTYEDVQRRYARANRQQGPMRHLPIDWLTTFFPPQLWKVAATLITDGPGTAKARIENYLDDYADEMLPADVSKKADTPGRDSFLNRVKAARKFMGHLKVLYQQGRSPKLLEMWALSSPTDADVAWVIPAGREHVRGARAVPGHIVRRVLSELNENIADRLDVSVGDYEAEVEAIQALPSSHLQSKGLLVPLMKRQSLLLLTLLATRADATCRLNEEHLVLDHELPDNTVQPAVKVHEWKTKERTVAVWKPILRDPAAALRPHIVFMHRWLVEVKGRAIPENGQGPLLYNRHSRRMKAGGLTALLSGWRPPANDRRRRPPTAALLPKERRAAWVGYSSHPLRSRDRQWVTSCDSRRFLERRRIDTPADWIAEALLGHSDNDMRKLYGGGSKPDDVELLSAIGTQLTWLNATTDLGARKVYDEDAYRETVENIRTLELDKQSIETQLDALPDRRGHLRKRRAAAEEAGDRATTRRVSGSLDALEDDAWSLNRQSTRVAEQLGELRSTRKALRNDPRALKLVADDVTSAEFELLRNSEDDLDAIDLEVYDGLPQHERRKLSPRRTYVSTSELAGVDGRSENFFKVLLNGHWPVKVRGVEPWARDINPCTDWSTAKRRGFLLDLLNPALPMFTDPDRRLQLAEILATPYPAGWGAEWEAMALPKRRRPAPPPA